MLNVTNHLNKTKKTLPLSIYLLAYVLMKCKHFLCFHSAIEIKKTLNLHNSAINRVNERNVETRVQTYDQAKETNYTRRERRDRDGKKIVTRQ